MTIATHSHPENLPARMPAGAAPVEAQDSALMVFARELQEAANIAASLARTAFVPATLRGKVEDLTAAILAGQELGLPVMATLRSIDVIQGTPGLRAHAMRGLVQSHGHSVQLVESTPDRCVMRGLRKGDEKWQEVTWTIPRAKQMGLTDKGEWKKQPQTMLVARATGEICRLIASDVLYAMPYAAEELDGMSSAPLVEESSQVTVEEILSSRGAPMAEDAGSTASTAEVGQPSGGPTPEDFLVRARAATTFAEFKVIWDEAGASGVSASAEQAAELKAIGARLKDASAAAAGQTPPAGVSAEPPSEADALYQQIVAAWPGTTNELNTAFAQVMDGVLPGDASEAELDSFLAKLKAGEL